MRTKGGTGKVSEKDTVQLVVGGQGGNTKMLSEQAKGEKEQDVEEKIISEG
jgi:hypothetical protein